MRAFRTLVFVASLVLPSCQDGCGKPPPARAPGDVAAPFLAPFPRETTTVLHIDFRGVRDTAAWKALTTLAVRDPKDDALVAAFSRRTGLDPWTDIHRVVAAFPEDARVRGEFGVLFEGEDFDRERLVAWAKDEVAPKGTALTERVVQGVPLVEGPGGTGAFFVGRTRVLLGGGGWAEKMIHLGDATAASNRELANLCARAGAGKRSIWAAAILPAETRAALRSDPRFELAASAMRLAVSLELGPALAFDLVAELSHEADAQTMVEKVRQQVAEAKKDPKVLVLGLAPYLDAVKVAAEGPNVRLGVALDEARTSEIVDRLLGLARIGRAVRGRVDAGR